MRRVRRLRSRLIRFIVIIQCILFAAHGFVYETWVSFATRPGATRIEALRAAMGVLSVSFVAASLVAFRTSNFWAKWFYKAAAVWLGTLNYLVGAAFLCWALDLGGRLFGLRADRPALVASLYALAGLTALYGLINARRVRVKRLRVKLPNLPAAWRGRTAALVSDLHLGHVNGRGFLRKIVTRIGRLRPDVVFIAGDLFDGVHTNPGHLAEGWKHLTPPLGAYFITGNHEEFSDPTKYLEAVREAGVRPLSNQRVRIEGLDIVGVPYRDAARPERLRSFLESAGLERGRASILLAHAPAPGSLAIAEQAGVSLQLSGHTHGGQIFPFTWVIRRVYREYAYGLQRFGEMVVYTSSGCGTWGPPLRVGTQPEIVLIKFE